MFDVFRLIFMPDLKHKSEREFFRILIFMRRLSIAAIIYHHRLFYSSIWCKTFILSFYLLDYKWRSYLVCEVYLLDYEWSRTAWSFEIVLYFCVIVTEVHLGFLTVATFPCISIEFFLFVIIWSNCSLFGTTIQILLSFAIWARAFVNLWERSSMACMWGS